MSLGQISKSRCLWGMDRVCTRRTGKLTDAQQHRQQRQQVVILLGDKERDRQRDR